MPAPAVTVCIPTYNYGHYLGGAIASVLDQTFEDFELLIADDVSSDDTEEVVRPFLTDSRVQFLPNEVNSGMFANFNRCVKLARGKYIKFLMADDWLAAECLAQSVALLESNPAVNLMTTASWLIDETSQVYASEFQLPLEGPVVERSRVIDCFAEGANAVGMPTCALVRTEALRSAGGFDASYAPAADIDLWFRLLADSDLGWIARPLTYLRIHTGHTHQWGDDPNESWLRVWRDAPARSGGVVSRDQMDFAIRRWSSKHSTFAFKHLLAGRPRRAGELWSIASDQIGSAGVAAELVRSLPGSMRARKITRQATRQRRIVRYSPTAELGSSIDDEVAAARAAMGPLLGAELSES